MKNQSAINTETEIMEEIIFDSGTADRIFSISKQKYLELDGEKHYVGEPTRMGVAPGDFEQVENFAPVLLPIFKDLWSDDIVKKYNENMNRDEDNQE